MAVSAFRFIDYKYLDYKCMSPVPVILEDHCNTRIYVGCGKCYYCLQKRRREWYIRNLVELLYSDNVFCTFVTLTYSDEFRPDGVVKSHLQKFLDRFRKRLQRHYKTNTRYFAVSEYGDQTGRPHYHLLLYHDNELGVMEYQQDLNEAWPFSSLEIDWHLLEPASISYVCNYVLSYVWSEHNNKPKPFLLSSRHPAIGYAFFGSEKQDDAFRGDYLGYNVNDFRYSLPRYYRDKILDDDTKFDIVETYLDKLAFQSEMNKHSFYVRPGSLIKRIDKAKKRKFIQDLNFNTSKHKL